ncbi:Sulfatase domain protein [Aspergillus sclerotialis]|uniref:Sulfatase domain protein n=1 Tax=Aspergillus sclerotialis TaxID=2070753 RepID=A0A3A2ZNN7_9EURO|nr:Sulfatase domain protein [Aspergillus sclerotialis]
MMVSRSHSLRPFLLSLLVVPALASKALHLFQHTHSLSPLLLALYFPTFFVLEILLFVVAWFLLNRTYGAKSAIGAAIVGLLGCITLAAASSQIGFYFVTGAEVRWNAAKSVGDDPEGRKLMLSGLKPVLCAGLFLLVLSWLLASGITSVMNNWFAAVTGAFSEESTEQLPGANQKGGSGLRRRGKQWTIIAAAVVFALWLVRPSDPYNHISGALPLSIFYALLVNPSSNVDTSSSSFPLPDLLNPVYWEAPKGHYRGWAPTNGESLETDDYPVTVPEWASPNLPRGFERWAQKSDNSEPVAALESDDEEETDDYETQYYDPVTDPLRITNLDHELFEPLQQALKEHDVPISHVVLVIMESARKDVFPFKSDSHLHQKILDSYEDDEAADEVNAKLSRLSPVAEILTGESSGFPDHEPNELVKDFWNVTSRPGMGGINVNGMLTGSTLSFKSALVNYCGVGPLPILNLFNKVKDGRANSSEDSQDRMEAIRNRKWKTMFSQSITELYDKQNVLNRKMGFNQSICREHLDNRRSKHYHSGMEAINYFGYPEVETYPYLEDVINDALETDSRLFLSHFTSTTHHPWGTPSDFDRKHYFYDDFLGTHDDMDHYLNAVRYVDHWLGKFMNLLEDTGIANETLVVFVGDHGQAFHEDSPVSGTYENGHISNFRIPVVFRHPLLPRLQVTANATTMSVVPTILDLLVNTKSLNQKDTNIALDLMNEYEGQSLIRPFQSQKNGRQAWNFGIINAGGTMLAVTSAAAPYRLVLPLTKDFEFAFSNLEKDPDEEHIINEWNLKGLLKKVKNEHGKEAAKWVQDAESIAKWWIEERKRVWNYHETV